MDNAKNDPTYLCGSIVFFLITQSTYPKICAADKIDGKESDHSDLKLMADFVKALTNTSLDKKAKNLKQYISFYKNCKRLNSETIPFRSSPLCKDYKNITENELKSIYSKMDRFIEDHLLQPFNERLVMTLLYVLKNDPEINDDELFYITSDRNAKTKTEVLETTNFQLTPFLTGIMHYTLNKRHSPKNGSSYSDMEKKGQMTLNLITDKVAFKERKLKDISKFTINSNITVNAVYPSPNLEILKFLEKHEKISSTAVREVSEELFDEFKTDIEKIMLSFLTSDFTQTIFDFNLKEEIFYFCEVKWSSKYNFILDKEIKQQIKKTLDTLSALSKFLSSQYTYQTHQLCLQLKQQYLDLFPHKKIPPFQNTESSKEL